LFIISKTGRFFADSGRILPPGLRRAGEWLVNLQARAGLLRRIDPPAGLAGSLQGYASAASGAMLNRRPSGGPRLAAYCTGAGANAGNSVGRSKCVKSRTSSLSSSITATGFSSILHL